MPNLDLLWTEERVEQLKKLWAENWATSYIAREMGTTRNSIIGKLHRLKMPRREFVIADKIERKKVVPVPKPKPKTPSVELVQAVPEDEPENRNVTLTELEFHHCREIVRKEGDDSIYCGGKRMAYHNSLGQLVYSSWCQEHHSINHGASDHGRRLERTR